MLLISSDSFLVIVSLFYSISKQDSDGASQQSTFQVRSTDHSKVSIYPCLCKGHFKLIRCIYSSLPKSFEVLNDLAKVSYNVGNSNLDII